VDYFSTLGATYWDLCALVWLLLMWIGYAFYTRRGPAAERSLLAAMERWRQAWAMAMLDRDPRIVDSQVINGLVRNVAFFASTTILILAGLVAMLTSVDEAIAVIRQIPFAQTTSKAMWELKLALLIVIFIYAFFKFGWSMRQHSYSAVVMAAAPPPQATPSDSARELACRMARLSSVAAWHFNDGIRAYYFALAALGWFIHAWAFMATSAWVVLVLYRREFRSRALALLAEGCPALPKE